MDFDKNSLSLFEESFPGVSLITPTSCKNATSISLLYFLNRFAVETYYKGVQGSVFTIVDRVIEITEHRTKGGEIYQLFEEGKRPPVYTVTPNKEPYLLGFGNRSNHENSFVNWGIHSMEALFITPQVIQPLSKNTDSRTHNSLPYQKLRDIFNIFNLDLYKNAQYLESFVQQLTDLREHLTEETYQEHKSRLQGRIDVLNNQK